MFASPAADRVPPCAIRARDAAPATVRTLDRRGLGRSDSCSPTASCGPGRCDLPRPGFNLCGELASQIQGRVSIANAGEGAFRPAHLVILNEVKNPGSAKVAIDNLSGFFVTAAFDKNAPVSRRPPRASRAFSQDHLLPMGSLKPQ